MTRREAVASAAGIFVLGLLVRLLAARAIVFPQPEDTSYYVAVARNLLEGRGLVSDALWSYGTPPLQFPRPAFEVWLPLPTWLAAVPMALLGTTFAAAQWSSILVGSVVPVLAWRIAADVAEERRLPIGRARVLALGSGVTAAVYLGLVLHSTLPDSTAPFAALALAACLLMLRILGEPARSDWLDWRLVGLGVLIGLAALTRNEAIWLALTWVVVAITLTRNQPDRDRRALILVPAVAAIAVFVPWAWRDWQVFGSPLPGQALANALSTDPTQIFAWNHPPTLADYLAQGPLRLLQLRVEGIWHNLANVLLLLGIPVAPIGLVALPWTGRSLALRPLLILSVLTFTATSLLFPVATTWGTFLHAAGPVHVLLIVSALMALDALIVRVGRWRGWTRPVAWLGPVLAGGGALLFSLVFVPAFGRSSADVRDRYAALATQLAAAGIATGPTAAPIITDFPIWLADTTRTPSLALPEEQPLDVLDLARHFKADALVVLDDPTAPHGVWPGVIDASTRTQECFEEVHLGQPADPALAAALYGVRAFRIVCP